MTDRMRLEAIDPAMIDLLEDDSISALLQLPADAWDAICAAYEEYQGCIDLGLDCQIVCDNHSNLDEWESARRTYWSDRGRMTKEEYAGKAARVFNKMQARKGDTRRDVIAIECGDCVAVMLF